ncbi:S41 family peptidase [Kitasatospora paracochleata]|uniref:Tail specific protease domain-containing protein n=1 Tax=Kitasatospora paracochleata TaxID=58354 RepID=A0ABT1J1B4_9ACTN|nr:S41 family peptidase [Kitasatospora paracochleata]MCP2311211.1 hypothetical protein [Kitasatospora paracochleata]
MTAALAVLMGVGCTAAGATNAVGAAPRSRWEGVWQTDGYGRVVTVDHGRLLTYDLSAAGCLPGLITADQEGGPDGAGAVRFLVDGRPELTIRPGGRPGEAVWNAAADVTDIHLHRLPALPPACHRATPPHDPLAAFDIVWTTFAENYPFFAAKGVDWVVAGEHQRARLSERSTDSELLAVLGDLLRPLGDAHVGVVAGAAGGVWQPRPGTLPVTDPAFGPRAAGLTADELGTAETEFAGGRIGYAESDRIGYLRIGSFQHYTEADDHTDDSAELSRVLDAVFTPERTCGPHALRGLVLDLRLNGGGSDRLGLQLAARLTDRPYLAYAKQGRDDPHDADRFTRPQPIEVRPAGGSRYSGPIAVLTSSGTMSAAESLTMALMGRSPHPVRIGAPTQGVFSDVLERTLPNGWTFGLPNERYVTSDGRSFDGAGITPDIAVPVYTEEEFASGHDSALRAARALFP